MESVFNISGCAIENQVKFATCTLLGAALTWWNGQIRTLGPEAYAMNREGLKKKMADKNSVPMRKSLDNKGKADDSSRNNHGHQQQPFKKQNVAKKCTRMQKVRAFARRIAGSFTGNTNVANTQKGNGIAPKGNGCFECVALGHFKRDCPKLKNKDEGNGNAQGWVYAVRNAEKERE
ncbi:putative reverse transcriptase domain-containing protein [Tanacetum coccineum]